MVYGIYRLRGYQLAKLLPNIHPNPEPSFKSSAVNHATNQNFPDIGSAAFGGHFGMDGERPELANINLQEDMRDLAAQGGAQIGLVAPSTDQDIAQNVASKAQADGIALKPEQVTVRRTGLREKTTLHIAAHYTVLVNCWLFSLNLHFAPSSDKNVI